MINKHKELHNQLIEVIAEYYNAHTHFLGKQNNHNLHPLSRAIEKMYVLLRSMKRNKMEMRRYFAYGLKKKRADRNYIERPNLNQRRREKMIAIHLKNKEKLNGTKDSGSDESST